MGLFRLLFPAEAARLDRAERLARRAASLAGDDEWEDPLLVDVISEIRAGREIKAVQVYRQLTGSSLTEAHLAVQELTARAASDSQ